VTVTEADERAYYDGHQDDFKQDEQVCASHILVKVKATPEATDGHADDEAKKIAQSALDQVKAGADFATLAKKLSEDQGSASKGGDLSCFGHGAMVPEFDSAAFALKPGEVSDLVKTQYGYHVIKVTAHNPETVLAFAQTKDRIHQVLTAQRARALLDEQVQALADALRHGKSLEDAARERGLQRQQSKPLARGDSTPPLASPALVARAFELKKGETEPEPFPLQTGGDAFIALADVQAPRPATLEEVKDRVRSDVLQEKTQAASLQKAMELKPRAEAVGLEKAAAAAGLVRKETPALVSRGQPMGDLGTSPALDEAAFALPEKALSDPIRVPGGYALVRVLEKKSVDPAAYEKEKPALIASLRQERKDELFRAFMQEARKRVTVQRNADAFKRVMAS
jgi:peptidyl-prolyl cis-trans isomerase D